MSEVLQLEYPLTDFDEQRSKRIYQDLISYFGCVRFVRLSGTSVFKTKKRKQKN